MEVLLLLLGTLGLFLSELAFFLLRVNGLPGRNRRANELLRAVLSPEEYDQLTVRGYVDIYSPGHPRRVYCVPGFPGYVQMREPGRPTAWLCLQPDVRVPDADYVVIHKLMIEGDEETYLRTANHLATRPF